MTGSFLDVDAPNTAWRSGSEDPIPVWLGRYSRTAFLYRLLACRELDGVARTDATFLHPGTKARTVSGRVLPYRYWPRWKQGLFISRIPPVLVGWTGISGLTDYLRVADPVWLDTWMPLTASLPLLGYGAHAGHKLWIDRKHRRDYLTPIKHAVVATLRTRDGVYVDIPRGLVHGADLTAVGRIGLPSQHALHDNDRTNLLDAIRLRLGHEALDARWNLEGAAPHMELHTPPQPPELVSWDMLVGHADVTRPYLGHSATGPVHWDLGDDSPHIGIGGGSGSGKSELMAAIVAQFMRGGAGVVVLDPKYVSHGWLARVPEVLYCREPQMIHDTVVWLDMELRRRGSEAARCADAGEPEPEFPRIAVVLEERNSLQTVIREHWIATKPRGAPMRAPALAALDRLASMGRSFGINVILAAQEVTKADIGSRNNYGAFALAGRLPVGAWRLVGGQGFKKPAMSSKPGRFGYVVAGTAQVFQGAYPNLKHESDRLIAWATQGEPLLDVRVMMQQHDIGPFPRWEPAASPEDDTEEYVTLREFAELEEVPYTLAALRLHSQRDGREFPDSMGKGEQGAKLYRLDDLYEWLTNKQGAEQ